MRRRRHYYGVAKGLIGAFVSRNNDVGGYWALGKLYKHAKEHNVGEIRIDLLQSTITPPEPEFNAMIEHFRLLLEKRIAALERLKTTLKKADATVFFSGERISEWLGSKYLCIVTLTDNSDHIYEVRHEGSCRAHDPAKESKRTLI